MNSLKKHPCRQNNPLVPFSPNTKGKRRPALQRHGLRWEWRLQRYSPGKRRQTSLLFSLSEQVPLRQPHKPKTICKKNFFGVSAGQTALSITFPPAGRNTPPAKSAGPHPAQQLASISFTPDLPHRTPEFSAPLACVRFFDPGPDIFWGRTPAVPAPKPFGLPQ